MFQHTAARRRLGGSLLMGDDDETFQHTAARRRLDSSRIRRVPMRVFQHTAARRRLEWRRTARRGGSCFNTQPPEGGWTVDIGSNEYTGVSTHSRPKAAGNK